MIVSLGSTRSGEVPVTCGVPQCSVLGPLLYILYTADVERLFVSYRFKVHMCADDTQAYTHCRPSDALQITHEFIEASEVLCSWMHSNRLLLNPAKTQLIWFGTRCQLSKIDHTSLLSVFPQLSFTTSVRDLGITLDSELTLTEHINALCRSCFYHLRQLRVIRRTLDLSSASTLVHSFICSRLDYGGSLYIGLPLTRLSRLQSVLRSAARLLAGVRRFDSISDYMKTVLHWLRKPMPGLSSGC